MTEFPSALRIKIAIYNKPWHKTRSTGHIVRIKISDYTLLAKFAYHKVARGASRSSVVVTVKIIYNLSQKVYACFIDHKMKYKKVC